MSVELQPFAPGEQPEQPSPEELEEDIAGNDKLAPMLGKLKDFENFVGKLSGGECTAEQLVLCLLICASHACMRQRRAVQQAMPCPAHAVL